MTEITKAAMDNILDTFAGADGGVKFTRVLFAIRKLDEQAVAGNKDAQEIINLVVKFSRLLDALGFREEL
jgi:hypothetical protein